MRAHRLRNTAICLCMLISMPALAAEIITEEDITEKVIVTEQLVRMTDNALFLFDTSDSMNKKFMDTGKTRLQVLTDMLKERNKYVPELGYKFGMYVYTGWKPLLEPTTYDRASVAKALDMLPAEGTGPTRLSRGLDKVAPILRTLSGKTVVFLFTDGQFTGKRHPSDVARTIARNFDTCFYVISLASERAHNAIVERVAGINECSRAIPFEYFINRREYTTGALFEVRASEEVITTTETKIVGVELDPLHFGFDSADLDAKTKAELDEVGQFMSKEAGSYVVINGYTDTSGEEEYNLHLSRRRTESAAAYLTESHGVTEDRIVRYWYGSLNPAASNDTREGRIKNRRLEMAIGGL